MTERNVLLEVQYDGTDFAGWQAQAGQRTVQQTLEEAVGRMVHHELRLRASSRTDAGVHARGLPVAFQTPRTIPDHGFLRGLNTLLPADVAVVSVADRPLGWCPRDAAVAKTYRYRFQVGPGRLPLESRTSVYVGESLDVAAMQVGAAQLVGDHDFSSFRSSRCVSASTRRTMHAVSVAPEPDRQRIVTMTVTGNAFLHNMVRIMAGTLLAVGRGKRPPDSVGEALEAGDRRAAGVTAAARGLTLHEVHFEGYPRLGKRHREGVA